MGTTTLHVTIDRETKLKAQKLAKELGLDLSTVVRAGIKNFVQTESFSVQRSYKPTPYLEEILREAEANPDDTFGPFDTHDDMVAFLDSGEWK